MSRPSLPTLSPGAVGPLLALAAFALYSTHDVIVKYLGDTYSVFQILFFTGLFSLPLVAVLVVRQKPRASLIPRHPGWVALRVGAVVMAGAGGFYAFTVLTMAQTYAILFAAPLIVTLLSVPMLGESVGPRRAVAVVAGLAGVLIVLRPGIEPLSLGHFAALLSAFCTGMVAIVSRKIGKTESTAVLMLYPMLANVVAMGVMLPGTYVALTWGAFAGMAGIAGLGFVAAVLVISAYRRAEAAVIAPMQYSQMIWAVIFGYVFFGEIVDRWTLAGSGLIIASGVYIVWREARGGVSRVKPVLSSRTRLETGATPRSSLIEDVTERPDK
jgi:S-adenosylmethionine uptake transporter